MRIRSKFNIQEVADVRYAPAESKTRIRVVMGAVYATGAPEAENVSYAKATPTGKIELTVDNPDAFAFFEPGREVYVDMTLAPRRCRACNGGGVVWGDRDPVTKQVQQTPCTRCGKSGIDPDQS